MGGIDGFSGNVQPGGDREHGALEAVQAFIRDPAVGFDILGKITRIIFDDVEQVRLLPADDDHRQCPQFVHQRFVAQHLVVMGQVDIQHGLILAWKDYFCRGNCSVSCDIPEPPPELADGEGRRSELRPTSR